MSVLCVVGTRPNFVKMAPLVREFKQRKIPITLLHTGQHYDKQMSKAFFDELKIPKPNLNLNVGSGSYGEQFGNICIAFEKVLLRKKPQMVIVVGDVNSTLAAALMAKQHHIPVAHVESGLRSFDRDMPEEINRILTDKISDYLFTTEESANTNLLKEGIDKEKIFFVGNVMIDTLLMHKKMSEQSKILKTLSLEPKKYVVLTLHRPSNVDLEENANKILSLIQKISKKNIVVFPIHPRTRKNFQTFGMLDRLGSNVRIIEPSGYLDFIHLMARSALVISDSGGIQEETTVLGVPCITLRDNTERPITQTHGTNILISTNQKNILRKVKEILSGAISVRGKIPPLWDGKAAARIVDILESKLEI